MTPADVEFAKRWAAVQVPPMIVQPYGGRYAKFHIDVRNSERAWMFDMRELFMTESDAWHALAAALAPIRQSMQDVMCGELLAENERLKERLENEEGAREILGMVADRLSAHGCEHGHAHKDTPPMFYPEWINCVVDHAKEKAKSEARLAASPVPS